MKRALIIALFTFTTLASFGISTCEAGGTEDSRQKIQWHLDYFIDAAVFTQAGYQFIGGPWSREIDPSQARINNRLNRILQTTTEDGPGSILYPLPKTLLPGEFPIEIVIDIGRAPEPEPDPDPDPDPDPGGGFPGGGKLHAFRAAGLILPEHQVIVQSGDQVVAWAEVTPEGSAIHLGGELDEFGSAINPTTSIQGEGIELDDMTQGNFTRLIFRLSTEGATLSYQSGEPRDLFGPAYETTNFDGLESDYIELASLDQAPSSSIDSVRFATNGGASGMVGVNTIAVFGHEMPEGVGPFIRGDVNSDSRMDIADAVFVFSFLFTGGDGPTCLSAMNSNAEAGVPNLTAGIYLLNYLFMGGGPPPAPFPECGSSSLPEDLDLGCEEQVSCQ